METDTLAPPPPVVNPFADRLGGGAALEGTLPVTEPKTKPAPKAGSLLTQITTRKRRRPAFFCLYGPPGVGKSTFGSTMPDPIFLQPERGLDQITVAKFPVPKTFDEFYSQLTTLQNEPHEFQSIVIDTADALEVLIWARVCAEGKVKSIEEFGGGYGKGYTRAREIWTGVLKILADLSERFNVALLAHSHIRSISDPVLGTAYDSHEIKLHAKSAEIVKQMVDCLFFVTLETAIAKDSPKAKKGRALIGEERILRTAPGTGYEAKNRYNLDNPIEFSWSTISEGIDKFYS